MLLGRSVFDIIKIWFVSDLKNRSKKGINLGFWETAHLPLPKPNILPKAISKG